MGRAPAARSQVLDFIAAALVAEPLSLGDAGQLPAGSLSTSASHGPSAAAVGVSPK